MATLIAMYRRVFPIKRERSASPETSSQNMKETTFARILSPFEAYVVSVQSILIWEKPYLSALTLLLVNLLFWLVVSYSHHFYSLVAICGLLTFVYRTWVYQICPEIRVPPTEEEDTEGWTPVNPQVLSVPELSRYLSDMVILAKSWVEWLRLLHQDEPGTFCILMTTILSIIAVLGQYVSGVFLAYVLVTSIMVGPGIIVHLLPKEPPAWVASIKTFARLPIIESVSYKKGGDSDLDEFLPETNSEMLEVLNSPLETSEPGPGGDAALMDHELGMDDLIGDELDLLPLQAGLEQISMTSTNLDEDELDAPEVQFLPSSDTNLISMEIKFVPTHFKDSDSEDEDARFVEGLEFPDAADSNSINSSHGISESVMAAISTVSQLSAVGQTLVAVLSATAAQSSGAEYGQHRQPSQNTQQLDTTDSDLADFEIVSAADLGNETDG